MAFLRARSRSDGSTYHAALYRLNGKQTATSFEDLPTATRFKNLSDKFGPARRSIAVLALNPQRPPASMTQRHDSNHHPGVERLCWATT